MNTIKRAKKYWPLLLIGVGLSIAYLPTLWGNIILQRFAGDLIQGKVTGTLWAPSLSGASLQVDALKMNIGKADVRITRVDPLKRTLHLGLMLHDVDADLKLAELLQKQSAASGWKINLDEVSVHNALIRVNGTETNLPDATVRLQQRDEQIVFHGRTADGPLSGTFEYKTKSLHFRADARVLRHYWKGIEHGFVVGHYQFGETIQGEAHLHDVLLQVPDAPWITAKVNATLHHKGQLIDFQMDGSNLQGPLAFSGLVDLQREQWTIKGQAKPKLAALAQSVGTTGKGDLTLDIQAHGWSQAHVNATVKGAGEVSGIRFDGLSGRYLFSTQNNLNEFKATANTYVSGKQQLTANWNNGIANATWKGALAQQPLHINAALDNKNIVTWKGNALGGALNGRFDLRHQELAAVVHPSFGNNNATISLNGSPDDLHADLHLNVAGQSLSGKAQLNSKGLQANLDGLQLTLDRQFRGQWNASQWSFSGIIFDGKGDIDLTKGTMNGDLTAQTSLLKESLSGRLNLNLNDKKGSFSTEKHQLLWRDNQLDIKLDQLALASGSVLDGRLSLNQQGQAHGTLQLHHAHQKWSVQARGEEILLNGHQLSGRITRQGQRIHFSVRTPQQQLRGSWQGDQVWAQGGLNLVVLRSLLPLPDLTGSVQVNLNGKTGTARLTGQTSGIQLQGNFRRNHDQIMSDLSATLPDILSYPTTLRLKGKLFPSVQMAGTLSMHHNDIAVALHGPYSAIQAQFQGQTPTLQASGITLPRQSLFLSGYLTPNPRISGTWGDLQLRYDDMLHVQGSQKITAWGESATITGKAQWNKDFAGEVHLQATSKEAKLLIRGPWNDLQIQGKHPQGQVTARASLPQQTYQIQGQGQITLSGETIKLTGALNGKGATPSGTIYARTQSGTAQLEIREHEFQLKAKDIAVAGKPVQADLALRNGRIQGFIRSSMVNLEAHKNRWTAQGAWSGYQLNANGETKLTPNSAVNLGIAGDLFQLKANGTWQALAGSVTLHQQRLNQLIIPRQTFALTASVPEKQLTIGGLRYAAGNWSGKTNVAYDWGQRGVISLIGNKDLQLKAQGSITGQIKMNPMPQGQIRANISPALPSSLQSHIKAGYLVANIDAQQVQLSLAQTRYLNHPVHLKAAFDLNKKQLTGNLSHPFASSQFAYHEGAMNASGNIKGQALAPFISDAKGGATFHFSSKGQQNNGQVHLDLTAKKDRLTGTVQLRNGQWHSRLNGQLQDGQLSVQGALYPRADTTLQWKAPQASVKGRLHGSPRQLALLADGHLNNKPLKLRASHQVKSNRAELSVNGTWANNEIQLHSAGKPDQFSDWKTTGKLFFQDTEKQQLVSATLFGTPSKLHIQSRGRMADVSFQAPLIYQAGELRAQGAQASLPQANVQANGVLYPQMDLRFTGKITDDVANVGLSGTSLQGRVWRKDWRINLDGSVSGYARGQLGSGHVAGLLDTQLKVNTAYQGEYGRIQLLGPLSWNAVRGFGGKLQFTGTQAGKSLQGTAFGRGSLDIDLNLDTAKLRATVASSLSHPKVDVSLVNWDLGAWWGKPDQLTLTGQGTLQKKSEIQAHFLGALQDTAHELDASLELRARNHQWQAHLNGDQIKATAYGADKQTLSLQVKPIEWSRLLPEKTGISALYGGGSIQLERNSKDLLSRTQQLQVRGQHQTAGPFSLYGQAFYEPQRLETQLYGSLGGGLFSLVGQSKDGIQARFKDLSMGQTNLNGDITLQGSVHDPLLRGQLKLVSPSTALRIDAQGTLKQPNLFVQADQKGALKGRLYAHLKDFDWKKQEVATQMHGTLIHNDRHIRVNLGGTWPRLDGQITDSQGLQLKADGQGNYQLSDSNGWARGSLGLGQGWLPAMTGQVQLQAPQGSEKQHARLNVLIGGSVTQPQISGDFSTAGQWRGLSIPRASGSLRFDRGILKATLQQSNKEIAHIDKEKLSLAGLQLEAAGSRLTLAGTANLSQKQASVRLNSTGLLSGELNATYEKGLIALNGDLQLRGVQTTLDLQGHEKSSWNGKIKLGGQVQGEMNLTGRFAHPMLAGTLDVLGAEARLVAHQDGVHIRLADGSTTAANGAIDLRPDQSGQWRWLGAAAFTHPDFSLSVAPSGPLADPHVTLAARRGTWQSSGELSVTKASLNLTDGLHDGTLSWNDRRLTVNIPSMDLARLDMGLSGRLQATGETDLQNGEVKVRIDQISSPQKIPLIALDFTGDIQASAVLQEGVPTIRAQATSNDKQGQATVNLTQSTEGWLGKISAILHRGDGKAEVNLRSSKDGLYGTLHTNEFPIRWQKTRSTVSSNIKFTGQEFDANVKLGSRAQLTAQGGIADVLPGLAAVSAVRPVDGYEAQAVFHQFEINRVIPQLSGPLSGQAQLSDGGGTFFMSSTGIKLGPDRLPFRLDGTRIGSDWRLRGTLGNSSFIGGLVDGSLLGQAHLRALPISSVVAAATGQTPGRGVITGMANVRLPVSDPLSGEANLVAERITVSTPKQADSPAETLTGSGTLHYKDRELHHLKMQLNGAGSWDIHGQYTQDKVNLNAQFLGTTFTPIFQLIPPFAPFKPALRGTLGLQLAGTYDQPRALITGEQLKGSLAGNEIAIPRLSGELTDNNSFSVQAGISVDGPLGADGTLQANGNLQRGLHNTTVRFDGSLTPKTLGTLPHTAVLISQADQRWNIEASAIDQRLSGKMQLQGQVVPRLDLRLTSQRYDLPIAFLYAKETALNADVAIKQEGENIRVSGQADFERMILGRVEQPASEKTNSKPTYQSPLPLPYTTFAQTQEQQEKSSTMMDKIRLEGITITAPTGIRIDENLIRAQFGTAGLFLSGSGAQPQISGDITAQRGRLFLRENEFTITKGEVKFTGESVYPTFDIEAEGRVGSGTEAVSMRLQMTGHFRPQGQQANVLQLETSLTCAETCTNPVTQQAYTEAELYALLATGVADLTQLPGQLGSLGSSALRTALNVFLIGELERALARALGLDVLRLSPTLENGDLNATFTVGSYLTRQLFLQYQVDLRGRGLVGASYTTPDRRFTFKASTPLLGFDLDTIQPSFSAAYNLNEKTSFSFGVQALPETTRFNIGLIYRLK